MTEPPQTLGNIFAAAKSQKRGLESCIEENNDAYHSEVNDAILKFEDCKRLISQLSLFSPNESLEDVATRDLQYLTVEYLLADILQRSSSGRDRETALRRALMEYERYLMRLDQYDLLSPSDKKLHELYLENPTAFTLASADDAGTRRQVKIARFREEKELKNTLESLSQGHELLGGDDDATRQLYLAEVRLYTHQTFQSIDLISRELAMLSEIHHLAEQSEDVLPHDPRRGLQSNNSAYEERLDAPIPQLLKTGKPGPVLSKDGRPLQPFTLTTRRSQLQKGVFRLGHNLPTMTIEEYLEEERRRGGIIQGGNKDSINYEVDEDDVNKAEEETMKARAWDEFREDNPRGSGNTLNRG